MAVSRDKQGRIVEGSRMSAGRIAVLVVAAGRGARAGAGVPKQYRLLAGRSVLGRCLDAIGTYGAIAEIRVIIHPEDATLYAESVGDALLPPPVSGGATRQASVRLGLEALADEAPDIVLVHDAVRPFVTSDLVSTLLAALSAFEGAVPAIEPTDTVKRVEASGRIAGTLPRADLRLAQTPQAFRYAPLLAAHRRAEAEGRADFTDDASLAEWAGLSLVAVPGDPANVKLTIPRDFTEAERRLAPAPLVTRVGQGFDVHAFGPGDHVWLGGLRIDHDHALVGHSDADVLLHALTDALLGALGEGDIGRHFPPSEAEWRGASSDRFLAFAAGRVRARAGRIDHLDATIICERPKIGPHEQAMRARIAAIAGIVPARVSVKATTSERLGFTGRGEGIAALAMATIRLPDEEEEA